MKQQMNKRRYDTFRALVALLQIPSAPMIAMQEASRLNMQFMELGRGKGRGSRSNAYNQFSKYTNWKPPHQGARECARRVRQGLGGYNCG